MKKAITVLALLAAFAAAAGAAPTAPNVGYVLIQGLAMYTDSNAKLTWLEALTVGDAVTPLGRTAKFRVDGKDTEYIRIRATDGKEGWVLPPYVATKASLAVVKVDQSVVYAEPRDVKVTSRFVTGMTVVAVLQDGSGGGFAKIQGYDRVQKRLFTDATYVSLDDLTMADTDVNAAILYTVAVTSDTPAVKASLLKVAMTKYGDSLFLPQIQAAAGVAAPRATTPASGAWVVGYDNVNLRAAPDEKNGQVIGRLMKGTRVEVSEMTRDTYTVAGSTAAWYHLVDPDGWVFGASLTPDQ